MRVRDNGSNKLEWHEDAGRRYEDWLSEYPISNVLIWYEYGLIGSMTVVQEQGNRSRVSWTEKGAALHWDSQRKKTYTVS